MAEITLYNTKTRRKEALKPIDANNVRMYVCGPTVYDRAHIGNARPVVVFDVLYRLLRHEYGAESVTYVRNFTDVDDKINARATEMQAAGDARPLIEIIRALTDETIGWYHEDMDALGALRPTHEPRATDYIAQMVAMIARLVEAGHAYAAEGHVLFDVKSYPEYGALARRSLKDMRAGARVEVAPYKRDPMDFVLWKPSSEAVPGWESPWGRGRPGWHVECSAMSRALLGESFDIHGGGIDLAFPHHENEVAQSACAHPGGDFARYWLHNGFLQIEGEKMSKSLGNFFTVKDLLDQGVPGPLMRYLMLSTHYRKPLNWMESRIEPAKKTLKRWAGLGQESSTVPRAVVEAVSDDLNTPKAIAELHRLDALGDERGLGAALDFLGIDLSGVGVWPTPWGLSSAWDGLVGDLVAEREKARLARNFVRADELRDDLLAAGIELQDLPTGTEWELTDKFNTTILKAIK